MAKRPTKKSPSKSARKRVPAVPPIPHPSIITSVQGQVVPPIITSPPYRPSPPHPNAHPHPNFHPAQGFTPTESQAYRELFWQNVMREMLVSLIVAQSETHDQRTALAQKQGSSTTSPATTGDANAPSSELDTLPMSDGRLGIVTSQGQRIPIARVFPVFAATVEQSPQLVQLSDVLQCSIFQIQTPSGEVYTLPLHEIRGFHAISEGTMENMSSRARKQRPKRKAEEAEPFGFAAFTSLARTSAASRSQPEESGPAGAD